jgi:hypothetical protein
MMPLALTDDQLRSVLDIAGTIAPPHRTEFLNRLAQRLENVEVGDGAVYRAAVEVARSLRSKGGSWIA